MSLLIRIEGLLDDIGSDDIVNFFSGLNIIPEEVQIISECNEAYVRFATDEHAYHSLARSGGLIKGSRVHLSLSSKSEMYKSLEVKENLVRLSLESKSVYVYLCGLARTTTKDKIKAFFGHLHVVDVLFFQVNNVRCGNAVVKFGSVEHASEALLLNLQSIDNRRVKVQASNEERWLKACKQNKETDKSDPEPEPYTVTDLLRNRSLSKSSDETRERTRSRSPHCQGYYIHLQNMPYNITTEDVKIFLGDPDMADSQITFLLDDRGMRTRNVLAALKSEQHQQACLRLHQSMFRYRTICIEPLSLGNVQQLLQAQRYMLAKVENLQDKTLVKKSAKGYSSRRCMYVRNLPADVTKYDIQDFFTGFNVNQEDIILLYDKNGDALGEALVEFSTEHAAMLAESLNCQHFLGAEVLLLRISEEQMKEFELFPPRA